MTYTARIAIQIKNGFKPEEVAKVIKNDPLLGFDVKKSKELGFYFEIELNTTDIDDAHAIRGLLEERIEGINKTYLKRSPVY